MEILDLGDRRLAYWETGSGPALVFIHGVGTSGELWAADLAELGESCRVIVYDRRGYGASSESPRDWRAHRDDAIALIDALGAAPAVVVGYSGGSVPALDLAIEQPDLLAALVLVDPAFNIKRCMTPGLLRTFVTARLLARFASPERGAEHWMRYAASYSTGGSAYDKATPERRAKLLENAPGIFADFASGGGEHIDETRLASIGVPTTIVDASLSAPFLRRSCARLSQNMPQARSATLENSGHHIALDAREDLLAILRDAVREAVPHDGGASARA